MRKLLYRYIDIYIYIHVSVNEKIINPISRVDVSNSF